MEEIDIENLDFEEYNREIYKERDNQKESKALQDYSIHLDSLKKFKKEINAFVKDYFEKNKIFEESEAKERRFLKYKN